MNTPPTFGVSALLYAPEDNLDYNEYSHPTVDANNHHDDSNFQLQHFNFDNNQRVQQHIENNCNFSQNFVPDQLPLQNHYGVLAPGNTSLGEWSGIPFNDCLTSSMFQLPMNTTPSPFQDHDTNRTPVVPSNDNDYRNEQEGSQHQRSGGSVPTAYDYSNSHRPPYAPSTQQYNYDAYGNVISPLRVMSEQYQSQLDQIDLVGAGLNPAFLVPTPPYTDTSQQSSSSYSKPSSKGSRQDLIPPPMQPPPPPANPGDPPIKVKRRRRRKPPPPPEVAAAKHKAFLQRNRDAASKCRTKKKAQIDGLEDEERMGRQINAVLKDEFKDVWGEVMVLRKQVKDMACDENCEGCGEHAPMTRDSVLATPEIVTGSVYDGQEEDSDEEYTEGDGSTVASLKSPLSVDGRLQYFSFGSDAADEEENPDGSGQ